MATRKMASASLPLDEIEKIANDVYATLGSGHSEEVYQRSMQVGLRLSQIHHEAKKVCELKYKDHYVGECFADIVVWSSGSEKVIVELKAIAAALGPAEQRQLRNYMDVLGAKHGILINFQQPGKTVKGAPKLELHRIVS
jgi:GxxExxY protein